MGLFKYFSSAMLVVVLAACGGGGGNPGTATGGAGTGTTTSTDTLLKLELKNSAGATSQTLDATGAADLVATLTTKDGLPVAGQVVSVLNGTAVRTSFPNGLSASTDASGVAKIKVKRLNLYEFGTDVVSAKFSGNGVLGLSSSSTLDIRVDPPTLNLVLKDSVNGPTSTIGSSGVTAIHARLGFADGTPVVQKRIDITGDPTKVSFPEGASQLTDSTGLAVIRVARAASSVGGAGTLAASATIAGVTTSGSTASTVVAGGVDYSVGTVEGAAKLSLINLEIGSAGLAAYGTRAISVQANLGSSAATTPVQITFSSNCGQIIPATTTTNGAGLATASFTATDATGTMPSSLGCSGKSVEIAASAVGADPIRKTLSVGVAPATNLAFIVPSDASKLRIYLDGAGGATQATIQFLLTNNLGEPIPSKDVLLTLKSLSSGTLAATKASFGIRNNIDPITVTTDALGKVSVPVFAGTVPTSVSIGAELLADRSVRTDSLILTIASGRPRQSGVSLSLGKFAIRGFNFDGDETTATISLSDRQGNPVPDGTAVNFVTEGGVMIPPVCTTGGVAGDSRCVVKIRTQNPRPTDGRISILAYASGEEDFIDANFNNTYDCGEEFADLGTAFRDNDTKVNASATITTIGSGTHVSISDQGPLQTNYIAGAFSVPRSKIVQTCTAPALAAMDPTPTNGDNVWGAADVRAQALIVFSTDDFVAINPIWSGGTLNVALQDLNANSIPSGSTLSAAPFDGTPTNGPACTVVGISNSQVPNQLGPLTVAISTRNCAAGDDVIFTVTTPATASGVVGIKKDFFFSVP